MSPIRLREGKRAELNVPMALSAHEKMLPPLTNKSLKHKSTRGLDGREGTDGKFSRDSKISKKRQKKTKTLIIIDNKEYSVASEVMAKAKRLNDKIAKANTRLETLIYGHIVPASVSDHEEVQESLFDDHEEVHCHDHERSEARERQEEDRRRIREEEERREEIYESLGLDVIKTENCDGGSIFVLWDSKKMRPISFRSEILRCTGR